MTSETTLYKKADKVNKTPDDVQPNPGKNKIATNLLLLILLSCCWLLLTVNSAAREFSQYDIVFIFSGVGIVWSSQLLSLFIVNRLVSRAPTTHLLTAVFAVVNFMSLYAVFIIPLANWATWQLLLLLAVALFIAYAFFDFTASLGKRPSYLLVAVVGGVLLTQVWSYASYTIGYTAPFPPAGKTSAEEVQLVEFKQKPNIYLISFDGMAPLPIVKEYMDIEQLPYQEWMEDTGFRRFKNAFSNDAWTDVTFGRILAFHPHYYDRLATQSRHTYDRLIAQGRQADLFNGVSPSPLLQIFKANGYRTHTYYRNTFFGQKTGPHVDTYNVFYPFSVCYNSPTFLADNYGFYGYCHLIKKHAFMKLWQLEDIIVGGYAHPIHFTRFALNKMNTELSVADSRHVFFMHIGIPGHVFRHYDHDNPSHYDFFREYLLERGIGAVVEIMQEIFDFIRQKDPKGIILYYADHGLRLSDKYKNTPYAERSPEIKRFTRLDQFGILMGIYPPDTCDTYFNEHPALVKYATQSMVLRQLLRCLAGGEDPLAGSEDPLPGFSSDGIIDYEEYLYE